MKIASPTRREEPPKPAAASFKIARKLIRSQPSDHFCDKGFYLMISSRKRIPCCCDYHLDGLMLMRFVGSKKIFDDNTIYFLL